MSEPSEQDSLFRKEAIEAHFGRRDEGEPLRLLGGWARWTFGLLVAVFLFAAAYSLVGTVDEYASGTALVRVQGRRELSARVAGTVAAVEVAPGQRVTSGQVLVRLHGDEAELTRVRREFELQLVKVLDDPGDQAARQRLTALRADREAAEARADERVLRAPSAGVVSDVRIQPGKPVQSGDTLLSVVPDDARFEIVAIVPGRFRPKLRPGMPMRLEMAGYPYAYREVRVESIGDQVVGPGEIRRYLSQDVADALSVTGPVVLVTATLPSRTFESKGKTYDYFDGMQGTAETRVGQKSVAATLLPALEAVLP